MHNWRDKKILIADDSEVMWRLLSETLKDLGFESVQFAKNGVEVLEILGKERIDVVSLDIIMPEMDGVECYKIIKKRFPDVKCFFTSVLCADQSVKDGLLPVTTLECFVAKPATVYSIESALATLYGLAQPAAPVSEQTQAESEALATEPSLESLHASDLESDQDFPDSDIDDELAS